MDGVFRVAKSIWASSHRIRANRTRYLIGGDAAAVGRVDESASQGLCTFALAVSVARFREFMNNISLLNR